MSASAVARQTVSAIGTVLHVTRTPAGRRLASTGTLVLDRRDRLAIDPPRESPQGRSVAGRRDSHPPRGTSRGRSDAGVGVGIPGFGAGDARYRRSGSLRCLDRGCDRPGRAGESRIRVRRVACVRNRLGGRNGCGCPARSHASRLRVHAPRPGAVPARDRRRPRVAAVHRAPRDGAARWSGSCSACFSDSTPSEFCSRPPRDGCASVSASALLFAASRWNRRLVRPRPAHRFQPRTRRSTLWRSPCRGAHPSTAPCSSVGRARGAVRAGRRELEPRRRARALPPRGSARCGAAAWRGPRTPPRLPRRSPRGGAQAWRCD